MALALCDPGDEAVICAPCYYSQKLALQIAQAKITLCKWEPDTLLPDLKVGMQVSVLYASPKKFAESPCAC
jgi:aspartate/methionine/tyrosine aminotransferase